MKVIVFKLLISLFFFAMLIVNYLANALPLNNRTIGAISSSYPSYFTPAGYAFSIWGLIYVLVGIVVLKLILHPSTSFFQTYTTQFIVLFVVSCLMNIAWLFSWHYDKLILSTLVMILLLVSTVWLGFYLSSISQITKVAFSIYAGWISVALIANITIMFVKSQLPIFINHQIFWYITIMIVGLVVAFLVTYYTKNIPYLFVFVWAYLGIFMKHLNNQGFYLETKFNYFNGALLALLVISFILSLVMNKLQLFKTV